MLAEDTDEVWDMAACAAFKDAFDRRYQEAAALEEEGGLTAERTREIQRELEHNITELEPSQVWHTCCWAVLRPIRHVRLSAAARRNVIVVRACALTRLAAHRFRGRSSRTSQQRGSR